MDYRVVCKHLGIIAMLIAVTMLFSLPWAYPSWGTRGAFESAGTASQVAAPKFETGGFAALCQSIMISSATGLLLYGIGGRSKGKLFHKEAMAVVGFAWILATVLGALPFYLSGTFRGPPIRVSTNDDVFLYNADWLVTSHWKRVSLEEHPDRLECLRLLVDAGASGIATSDLTSQQLETLRSLAEDNSFRSVISVPAQSVTESNESDQESAADNNEQRVYLRWVRMSFIDSMFESQSGFSTTGATVISDLENPNLVPHCILFWRSSTHFLGGLGIIVLFVAIAGQGSAGKALMRNEVPGPSQENSEARIQNTAQVFAFIYCALTAVLAALLWLCGLSWFDALCHAFGTLATGGFSTYNASLGHFDSPLIDGLVIVFMVLAGMNFTLLYFLFRGIPSTMWNDIEWRTYMGVILIATAAVVCIGLANNDFSPEVSQRNIFSAIRYGLFQVVSVMTTTGYGTHDFNAWSQFSRCILLLLMFVGGCAGSTGGGIKVIRWVLLTKILGIDLERAHHPRVVRTLRLGGKAIDDDSLRSNIMVYFVIVAAIFLVSWLLVVGWEPNATWAGDDHHKLIDAASSVAATLNNIGPGLGTVGATQNYGHFSGTSKLLFTGLMMLGRVEVFAILVLFMPSFWRTR